MTDDEQQPEYELVMPFRVCQSQGGPYDDESFVAGWTLGQLDRELAGAREQPEPVGATLRPAMMPQADLIAMKHGFEVDAEPWDEAPDDWVLVTFLRRADWP